MADYTKSNELMTRISLKYDSYANWLTNDPVLLAGEVAIATIPADTNVPTKEGRKMQDLPNVVMKVGDGSSKYSELKFVSALAADVYDWAKAATKPSYAASEIGGLKEFVENISDIDTNTQYTIVPVAGAEYKYELKKKDIGEAEFSSFATPVYMDMSGADTRLKALEDAIKGLTGSTGGIQGAINTAIDALDAEKDQAAGADGLALHIKQENGVITEFSGSIAANTYDAYGAAAAVQGETTHTVAEAYALADAAQTADEVAAAVKGEADARKAAIEALDFAGVEGTQEGATIKFVDKISQADGIVTAELGELVFNSAYNASTNKAATMSDVTTAVADLNGAMHFEGVYEELPTVNHEGAAFVAGDVIIVGKTEYVYSNDAFVQLGDEGAIAASLAALSLSETGAADKTLKISQDNGKVSATEVAIQIAKSQVTSLEDDLKALADEDDRLEGLIGDNADAIAVINDKDTGKSMRTVATEEAVKAVQALDKENAAQAGKYISAISQVDGVVTASYADLPVIPALSHTDSTATIPTAEHVAVVADISVDGHTITDTRVNVATTAGVAAAIAKLDADLNVSDAKKVMTGVTEVDGVLTGIDEVALADIAFSGNVKDLKQDTNSYVVFNCGSSSINV